MITGRALASLLLAGAAIACAGGCKSEWRRGNTKLDEAKPSGTEPPVSNPTLTGAAVVNGSTAIDQMVDVRCARAATCSEIGPDAKFDSRARCVERVGATMKGLLTVNECPAGVDQKALTTCLDAIEKESCAGHLDALDSIRGCGLSTLCPIGTPRP